MKNFIIIFRFLVSPLSVWTEEMKVDRKASEHEHNWFYPLLAVVGATAFVQMIYGTTLVLALVRGIALFVAFFLSYMMCPALVQLLVRKTSTHGVTTDDAKIFTMYNLSIGALVALVQNLLPAPLIPMYILLFYVLFILWKCAPTFGIETDEKKNVFVFGTFFVYLLIPLLILQVLMFMTPD